MNPYDPNSGKWLTPFGWAPATGLSSTSTPSGTDLTDAPDFMSGQNAGGKDIGYNGEVHSFGDFAKAVAGGLSLVGGVATGGIAAPVLAGFNLAMGNAPTSGARTFMQSVKDWWSGSPITGTTTPTINPLAQFSAPPAPGQTYFVGADDSAPSGLFDMSGNGEKGMAEINGNGFDAERMEGKNSEGRQGFEDGGSVTTPTTAPHAGIVLGPPKGDKVPLTVAAGSFVLSRDMVDKLGGPLAVAKMFTGKAPSPNQTPHMVPIRATGGEFVVSPADVKKAGGPQALKQMTRAPFGWRP